MKTDTPGFLDVKLTVVTKDKASWLDGLAAVGDVEVEETNGDWTIRRVRTSAVLRDMTIRVLGYVGPPTADVTIGFVGSDRIVSDGTTEIPDVSIAVVPRVAGEPGKDTLMTALKEALREAAKSG
ncbi:MAG TPA: hypothetical protein VIV40_42170 [Kofleriaceae bacterium]